MRFVHSLVGLSTVALSLAAPAPAHAQPVTTAEFPGKAVIGTASRDVVIRFRCAMDRGKINNLGFELDVPSATELGRVFGFDKFEGPDGVGGKHHLAVSGQAKAEMDFSSTGSYTGAAGSTFNFSAGMTKGRDLRNLQAVVKVLGTGAGYLTYTIANPARSGPALRASADMSDADAARLRQATATCTGAR